MTPKKSQRLRRRITFISIFVLSILSIWIFKNFNINRLHRVGEPIDSLNGVVVYYNGGIGHVSKRNVSEDGYNIGLKYQCVEFIKRYYYEHYDHKMPNSYGNAKDFFNRKIKDGEINSDRALYQFTNPSKFKPRPGEILVLGGTAHNRYGHVVIISEVGENEIEIIQQNPGPFGESRVRHPLVFENGMWRIENDRVLGRLGKERNKLILRK